MPWSQKQHNLFAAAAHDPAIAKKHGIKAKDASRMAAEGVKKGKGKRTLRDDVSAAYDKVQGEDNLEV